MTWTLLELAGLALVIAFCAVVWWPSALLVAGVLLVTVAWLGERRQNSEPDDEEATA